MTKIFTDMLITALYAIAAQNLIFASGFGISESIRMARRPKHFVMYAGCVTFFAFSVSVVCNLILSSEALSQLSDGLSFPIIIAVLAVIYLICGAFCKFVLHANKKFMNALSMCAFNTLIIALPALNSQSGNSVTNSIALALGAGIAFSLSLVIIRNGVRFIKESPYIPDFFKGTPAIFIYVSLIALTFDCIAGKALYL